MTAKELREKAREVIAAALVNPDKASAKETQVAIDVLRLGVVFAPDGNERD